MIYLSQKSITKRGKSMTTATVTAKGWVVIPKEYRDRYGLRPGTRVQFIDYGGILSIVTVPEDPIAEGLGALRRFGGENLWTQALLRERTEEQTKEEQEIEPDLRP
jgi:looped-hinge helix DNA binding domain, AbrB family